MAATASTTIRELPRDSRSPTPEPLRFRVLAWSVVCVAVTLLGIGLATRTTLTEQVALELAGWTLMVALVDLAPVALGKGPRLDMDLPLLLAVGFLWGPVLSGLVAFVGSLDPREFRRQISPAKACYNRAQKSLSVMAAATVFASMDPEIGEWPYVAGVAILSLAADGLINYSLVTWAGGLLPGESFSAVLSRMKFGHVGGFIVTYTCFGLLGLVLAEIYLRLGLWGLAAFVVPVVLARQTFAQGQRLDAADRDLQVRERALKTVSERVADERRDERLNVAAGLHDEVLPALYKVHLMGQVLRQELTSGRLLALEDDVPELVRATEHANDMARLLIRDLRRSSLGAGGFTETLRLLVRHVESESRARIRVDLANVSGSPLLQLLMYQVAREALHNAVRHSSASEIRVRLVREDATLRLIVIDDGSGFDPGSVDTDTHFGLQLMAERVGLAGGVLQIRSAPGEGTSVVARFPVDEGNET